MRTFYEFSFIASHVLGESSEVTNFEEIGIRSILLIDMLRRCKALQIGKFLKAQRCYSVNKKPELTSVRYNVQRGMYGSISSADIHFFEDLLGPNRLITAPEECEPYNIDFAKTVRGNK